MRKTRFPNAMPLAERFWLCVSKAGDDECWPWTGSRGKAGYGQLTYQGKHFNTHRVSYELNVGPVPEGLNVLHTCDVRACCNPAHLWPGTQSENMIDAFRKGRVKLTPHIAALMEAAKVKREARIQARKQRIANEQSGIQRPRDAMGRMIKQGQVLPPRKRNEHGHFQ